MKVITTILLLLTATLYADPLPSWNNTGAKKEIIGFVEKVTNADSSGYVPPSERIATFDNDGCLWSEQPMYFQLYFIFDRIKQMAPEHPEWKTQEPMASVLKDDIHGAFAGGTKGLLEMAMATHTDISYEDFEEEVRTWLKTAKHPQTGKPYTEMVFQPMLELLAYLRANGFKTYIVSGGGIDFLRVFSEEIYGIPPEQVVGTSFKAKYEVRNGQPVIMKLPEVGLIDDKEGKPVGIYQHIGRRPIFAAGNSDGDYQMLQYTTAGKGPRFGLIVHHTDAEREWAYDRDSHVGTLNQALDDAPEMGWHVIDMKSDWATIYPNN